MGETTWIVISGSGCGHCLNRYYNNIFNIIVSYYSDIWNIIRNTHRLHIKIIQIISCTANQNVSLSSTILKFTVTKDKELSNCGFRKKRTKKIEDMVKSRTCQIQ